jgi:hypothetical protein
MKNLSILLVSSVLFLTSCIKESNEIFETVKKSDNSNQNKTNIGLPVFIDSTNICIFPVSESNPNYDFSSKSYSRDFSGVSYSNIIFFDLETNKQSLLANTKLKISDYQIISELNKNFNQIYILYKIYSTDTNGDKKINSDDALSLFYSNYDGSGFKQITNSQYSVYKYSINENYMKIFISANFDTDNNKIFDSKDIEKILVFELGKDNEAKLLIDKSIIEKLK